MKIINKTGIGKQIFYFLIFCCAAGAACQSRVTFANLIGANNKEFFERGVRDAESKFIGRAAGSGWKIDAVKLKNTDVSGAYFLDDNHAWLTGAFDALYKTENAGKDWKTIKIKLPDGTDISEIAFADKNNGWMIVAKYNINITEAGKNQFWIMKTADGGETWNTVYTEKAVVVGKIAFADKNTGFVSGYKYAEPDKMPVAAEGFLLKTEDGGANWKDISKAFNNLKRAEDKKNKIEYMNDSVDHIVFLTPDRVKMVTHSRRVLETADGGKTWEKTAQYAHDDAQVGIVNFGHKTNGSEWFLESAYSIEGVRARLKTRDPQKGLQRRLMNGVFFNSAYYLSDNTFIAAGRTGDLTKDGDTAVIWLTTDDGKTWSEIYTNKEMKSVGLMRVSENSFWGFGGDGSLVHLYR